MNRSELRSDFLKFSDELSKHPLAVGASSAPTGSSSPLSPSRSPESPKTKFSASKDAVESQWALEKRLEKVLANSDDRNIRTALASARISPPSSKSPRPAGAKVGPSYKAPRPSKTAPSPKPAASPPPTAQTHSNAKVRKEEVKDLGYHMEQAGRKIAKIVRSPSFWCVISLYLIMALICLQPSSKAAISTSELHEWDQRADLGVASQFILPTHKACLDGDIELWERAISEKWSPNRTLMTWHWKSELDGDVLSPVHLAVINGRNDFLVWMESQYGRDILQATTGRGRTSIWLAANFGHFALVEGLLNAQLGGGMRSLLEAQFSDQRTIAHLLVLDGNLRLLKQVAEIRPELLRVFDCKGNSPLSIALETHQSIDMITWLVTEHNAGRSWVKFDGDFGITFPTYAAYCGRDDVLKWIYTEFNCSKDCCNICIDHARDKPKSYVKALLTGVNGVRDQVFAAPERLSAWWSDSASETSQPATESNPSLHPLTHNWSDWHCIDLGKFDPTAWDEYSNIIHTNIVPLLYATNEKGAPLYFMAARSSDRATLESVIQSWHGFDWNRTDFAGSNIMHYAAQSDDEEFFSWLVSVAPLEILMQPNNLHTSPCNVAIAHQRFENLRYLIGAFVDRSP